MLHLHHHHHNRVKRPKSNPERKSRIIELSFLLVAIVSPLATLPQIHEVWTGSGIGVSLLTWSSYSFFAGMWLVYGIIHRSLPIVVTNTLWLVVNSLVIVGVLV